MVSYVPNKHLKGTKEIKITPLPPKKKDSKKNLIKFKMHN